MFDFSCVFFTLVIIAAGLLLGISQFVAGLFRRLDNTNRTLSNVGDQLEKINRRINKIEGLSDDSTEHKKSALYRDRSSNGAKSGIAENLESTATGTATETANRAGSTATAAGQSASDESAPGATEIGQHPNQSIWQKPVLSAYQPPEVEPRPTIAPLSSPIVPPDPPLQTEPLFMQGRNMEPAVESSLEPAICSGIVEAAIVESASPTPESGSNTESEYPLEKPQPSLQSDPSVAALERFISRTEENNKRHRPSSNRPDFFMPKVEIKSSFDDRASEIFHRGWNWFWLGKEKLDENDTLEYVVAANWLTRLGMIILVLGLGFFIKYSIDKGWLVPEMRIAGTTIVGILMYLYGIYLWKGAMNVMGQAFIAGGAATLYFSFYAASELYHLVNPQTAFLLSGCVTVILVISALRRRSQLIAVLGVLGAYATPFMFDITPKSPVPMLVYLTILAAGLVIVRQVQKWVLPVWIAGIGTIILYCGLLNLFFFHVSVTIEEQILPWTFTFLSFGGVLFILMNFCAQGRIYRNNKPGALWELILMILNALIFFGIGYSIIRHGLYADISFDLQKTGYRFLSVGMAGFFFILSYLLVLLNRKDNIQWAVCCGLAFVFLSFGVQLTVTGPWRVPLWLIEATAFLWISHRVSSYSLTRLINTWTAVLLAVTLFIIIWPAYRVTPFDFFSGTHFYTDVWNIDGRVTLFEYADADKCKLLCGERAFRFLVPSLCGAVMAFLSWRRRDMEFNKEFCQICGLLSSVLLIVYLTAETNLVFGVYFPPMRLGAISVLWSIIALILIISGMYFSSKPIRMIGLVFFAVIIGKIFIIDLSYLDQIYRIAAMVILGLLVLCAGGLYLSKKERERKSLS